MRTPPLRSLPTADPPRPGEPARGAVARALLPMVSSLRIPAFRWLWLANVGFFAAMQAQQVAQGWLVYEMTGDPLTLGGISAAMGVAMLTCSLFGGVFADRVAKRRVLLATQAILATITLVAAVLITSGEIRYWHLLVASLLSGVTFSFNMPARQALVAEIVGEKQLANAIALSSAGMNLMRIGAPAAAGLLIGAVGVGGTYFAMLGSYVFVIAMILMVPDTPPAPRRPSASILGDLREGATYLLGVPVVLTLVTAELAIVLVGFPYQMLLPVFARDVLRIGPSGLGGLLSAVGAGALLGSLVSASVVHLPHRGKLLLGAGILFGLGLVGFAAAPSLPVAVAFLALAGAGSSVYMSVDSGLVMGMVEQRMRGRVMSIYMLTWGLMPLGTLPSSAIAGAFGAPLAVGLGGGILATVMSALALFRPAIRRLR